MTKNSESAGATPATASALRTLELERAGIAALEKALVDNGLGRDFTAAVDLIGKAPGRVIVTGMGKSGHIGRKIAATLASTGQPAYFVHPGEASHGDLGMIQSGDVVLALSWSGETVELADIITYSRRFRIGLIAITSNAEGALGREADVCLCLPKSEEACPNGLAPTTSTTMQLAIADALAIALLEAKGFTAQDFRVFHPGGKLGAKLTFVRDLMHRGERVPLVAVEAGMGEAVVEISSKGFGCVGVVRSDGVLEGIVTDGDLRRHMRSDLMAAKVADVMTRAPRTVTPDTLAVEALEMLNSRKISAMLVVDEANRPCGIVHLHDLLRVGVA
ncbi:MAG: KpsF/GutQ family sugar-phosphate isomerase [Hyphomicrobiales bacterium]|jgi:arabinose-5-phosphate isomerase|nr:KpsF/GutQ family sugar-phosphate isomerase [Hyphomicrobiales bacterium]